MREKEDKTNQAREPYNGTKRVGQSNEREPNNGTKRAEQRNKESRTTKQRETNNETKRAGQVSEAVEHPLTFGSYINNQIGK